MLAAGAGLPLPKVAMWEPPYLPDDARRPRRPRPSGTETMVAEGRRGDAVEFFMAEVVGLPPEFVAGARQQPFWEATEGSPTRSRTTPGSWATTGSPRTARPG